MEKIGRNDPCPCGSGLKYKRCCADKDEQLKRAERVASNARLQQEDARMDAALKGELDEYRRYMQASGSVAALIHAGKLDEAEVAARKLIEDFPDAPDGFDRMGAICEARGDPQGAARWYRRVIDFIRQHPQHYSEKDSKPFHRLIQMLDPAAAAH
jgi:tetratricopeptide (TPR) repeat protein